VCEDSGADFIAVHGRTRVGRYKAPVDYNAIAEIKSTVSIPVICKLGDIYNTLQKKPKMGVFRIIPKSQDGSLLG